MSHSDHMLMPPRVNLGGVRTLQRIPSYQLKTRKTPWWKRSIDMVGAAFGLLVLAVPLLCVAALIKFASPRGPVFFRQKRYGIGGEEFEIFKFRTMHQGATAEHQCYVTELAKSNGVLQKPDLSSRLIWLGDFYRTYAIDELPQLINVLKGEMSLVGPRPDVLTVRDYEPWQRERFEVLPGLTGLWQTSGKNELTFEEMVVLDIYYLRNLTVWMDSRILLKTVSTILLRR